MNKPLLCDWLPNGSDASVEYSKRYRRALDVKARRIQTIFPGSTAIAEQEALDLWGQIMRRIDARLKRNVGVSDTAFLYDYVESCAIQVIRPLPSPEGYVVLVEDFPTLGFRLKGNDLPSLHQIRLPQDIHIIPFPRPTWILTVSHENPGLPPIQFDLRSPHSNTERSS